MTEEENKEELNLDKMQEEADVCRGFFRAMVAYAVGSQENTSTMKAAVDVCTNLINLVEEYRVLWRENAALKGAIEGLPNGERILEMVADCVENPQ